VLEEASANFGVMVTTVDVCVSNAYTSSWSSCFYFKIDVHNWKKYETKQVKLEKMAISDALLLEATRPVPPVVGFNHDLQRPVIHTTHTNFNEIEQCIDDSADFTGPGWICSLLFSELSQPNSTKFGEDIDQSSVLQCTVRFQIVSFQNQSVSKTTGLKSPI